mmetsp:Transcript_15969/g.24885  ORF Transcript_15969/g.24885 Transcript_15969/m.24885 type:complete len:211 (-) Transcript_15969:340-972(-)
MLGLLMLKFVLECTREIDNVRDRELRVTNAIAEFRMRLHRGRDLKDQFFASNLACCKEELEVNIGALDTARACVGRRVLEDSATAQFLFTFTIFCNKSSSEGAVGNFEAIEIGVSDGHFWVLGENNFLVAWGQLQLRKRLHLLFEYFVRFSGSVFNIKRLEINCIFGLHFPRSDQVNWMLVEPGSCVAVITVILEVAECFRVVFLLPIVP